MAKINRTSLKQADAYRAIRTQAVGFNETNDCAVVAVAAVTGKTYAEAHAALAKRGRKNRQGTATAATLNAIREFGFIATKVNARFFIDQYPGVHKGLKGVTTHHMNRFKSVWENGNTYLLRSQGHILAVKNGQNLDWSVTRALRIKDIWVISHEAAPIPAHSIAPAPVRARNALTQTDIRGNALLTKLEAVALFNLFRSSEGNGHDFGFTDEAHGNEVTKAQAPALVGSLEKKGIIYIYHESSEHTANGAKQFDFTGIQEDREGTITRLKALIARSI